MVELKIGISRFILDALKAIIELLKDLKINYALMGGIALQVWGRLRVTKDIDIVVEVEKDRLEVLIDLLRRSPFSIRNSLKPIGRSLLIFATYEDKETGFPVELDLFVAQTEFQRETLKRAYEIEVLDEKLKVITAEDLILYKLLADRPIDFVDAKVLLEENRKDIDKTYLKNWAKKLRIQRRLEKLLK